ncbi:UBP-type zinc finger domain-containing protein [Agromyces larvae]|uniref:UBP-type zinc finger domain-containing protein n=1 Tax=Agromyces larvae TaxID=2929802 RepID=A0ABY4BZU1_9MICO|nr:UBP-type zinc finger domain-containing protein [Agromyces larvae]UOE43211.1 UBP-type zinc finger domain-containing protein [Agromyces larvae]
MTDATTDDRAIRPEVPPSGDGCGECLELPDGWWFHLRRCAACGHIGCCDSSPGQHASRHAQEAGHPVAQSFEPGEDWMWDYARNEPVESVELAPPTSRPEGQRPPSPRDRVPDDWREQLHRLG